MKKIFIISLLTVYVTLTAGLNVFVHTCGGESEALLATTSYEDPCGCSDDMSPSDMCCTTELTTVKIDDAQISSLFSISQDLIQFSYFSSALFPFNTINDPDFGRETNILFSPPPNNDLTIFNSVFLI